MAAYRICNGQSRRRQARTTRRRSWSWRRSHTSTDDDGVATCTYDRLTLATGLSRAKVANGLSVLAGLGVIGRKPAGRSTVQLTNFGKGHSWSKLPARNLYSGGRIVGFQHFTLRSMTELHAMKLYYLFARRRSNDTNMAHLSYDKIEEYADIERHRIKPAISVLLNAGLVHIERTESRFNERGTANAYRLAYLDSYLHFGTRGAIPISLPLTECLSFCGKPPVLGLALAAD
jgi:hypothetical protein